MIELHDRSPGIGGCIIQSDDDLIICRCEEITKGEIRRAVHEGFYTMTEIRRYLRVGMGLCQGNTCGRIVKGIIARELNVSLAALDDCSYRGPARPVEMEYYGNEVEGNE
jgi:bacterioferritin-associated ferredoxin